MPLDVLKRKARGRRDYLANRDAMLEKSKIAYLQRKNNGYLKEYYSRPEVKERSNKRQREYLAKYYSDPVKKQLRREQANARERQRRAKDPAFDIAQKLRRRFNDALRTTIGGGTNKKSSVLILLGCTIPELIVRLESKFKDGMTWENRGKAWHIDHIMPIAHFDLRDIEQQKVCFHYSNLQPLLAFDNRSKGKKILVAQQQ